MSRHTMNTKNPSKPAATAALPLARSHPMTTNSNSKREDNMTANQPTKRMRVLVACEYSGKVREAFRALGHDAWSCDLLPADDGSPHHIQGDVLDVLDDGWDLMCGFPPCTALASSGARWFAAKRADGRQQEGIDFFMALVNAPIPRILIENPIGIMSTQYWKPDQIVQPWQYGHGETKATCFWLKGLPPLTPTDIVSGREQRIWKMSPSEDRWKKRSETYQGIANAIAAQYGGVA